MSSTRQSEAQDFHAMLAQRGVHFIDAPGVDHFFAVDALAISTTALQCALAEI
jgi:3-hydroxyisobutyrate dehydrogenase-like beta-hydroxyacid dehydrogenase